MSANPIDKIAELEAEIERLKNLNAVNSLLDIPLESQILSPALPTNNQYFEVGQPIAFIHNRIDVVPGIIRSVNKDETYNLEVFIPTQVAKVRFNTSRTAFDRVTKSELVSRDMMRARPFDPRTIFRKKVIRLEEAQAGGGDGIEQTTAVVYQPSGKIQVPRFHDFHTSLIGTFFDPSLYVFRIYCWRAAIDVQGQPFPTEEKLYPTKEPYFTSFSKAFNRYFKEYHQGMSKSASKWNRVDIQVFSKEDV